MQPDVIDDALERGGVVDLADLGINPLRAARRHGLVLLQRRAAVAQTQPAGPIQHMHAAALVVPPPRALLSESALWAHGWGQLPSCIEIGVEDTRGLSVRPPVIGRRVAAATLAGAVVRRGLPVVALETGLVQSCVRLTDAQALLQVERLLRARATTPGRLRAACRRGFEGSRKIRAALDVLGGGDLELQKRRLRAALTAAGVIGLRSEVRLVSATGASCYLDLLHDPSRQAIEVDGGYHDLPGQRSVDRRKDRWVRGEHGIEIVRVADEEVRRDLAGVVLELLALLGY